MEDDSLKGSTFNQSVAEISLTDQKPKSKHFSSFQHKRRGRGGAGSKNNRQKMESKVDKANSYFSCECAVCKQQITKGARFEIKKTMNLEILTGKRIPFSQLIEYLLPPNEKVKGCQILFTDTVFFAHGKPQFIARNDKEGCLMIVTQASKLALQDIRQRFSTIVRERKKETQLIVFNSPRAVQPEKKSRKDNIDERSSSPHRRSPSEDRDNGQQMNDEKSIYYKDTAVIRFEDDEVVKVVRDTEFINEFRRRANDDFWKTLTCIQTAVKAKTGIGHPIFFIFYAPINEAKPNEDVNYDSFKTMEEDLELLKSGQDEKYAYKQCLKISYYVSKVYNQEILQMKTVFLKDENGNIWFFYAQNIQIRQVKNRLLNAYDISNKRFQQQTKEQLLREINEYEKEVNVTQTKSVGRMLGVMDSYYTNMKRDLGLAEPQNFEVEDTQLNEVLLKLKPNTTAANFKDFLQRTGNFNGQTRSSWRQGSRQNAATRSQQRQAPSPFEEQIKSIMSKRNQGNLKTQQQYDDINTLFKQQFKQNLNRSQIVSREREHNTKKANFRAELVRNDLINRSDLMKIYEPPIKKSQLPTNNPFYTKTILQTEVEDSYAQMPDLSVNSSQAKNNQMLNWSMYNNTRPLLKQITKRMGYLKCMEQLEH